MPYQLIVDDEGITLSFPLSQGQNLIGSGEGCDVLLEHPAVSRRHAAIRVDGDRIEIEDLDSRNGTRVDGATVQDPRELEVGDDLIFATLPARLGRIDVEDLEAGIVLGGGSRSSEEPSARGTPTFGAGALSRFVLDHLPGLLDRVESGEAVSSVAQAAGAALAESLPCREVTVVRRPRSGGEPGALFRATPGGAPGGAGEGGDSEATGSPEPTEDPDPAGDETTDPSSAEVVADAGEITLRVRFLHPTQARSLGPVVTSAARLVGLAGRRSPKSAGKSPDAEIPDATPPDPPSVDPVIQALYRDAGRVARGDVGVLITGESGTGKELLARFIHAASRRCQGPFVAMNCAALPRDLLEAELFGVEKGVATGVEPRAGRFERADGGTLFLDEIGDMAAETQARILRVLQEGEVYRVGGQQPRSARVRVVAATNRDIETLMSEGAFRSDLYHRIADWQARLPPLRERPGDIPNLAAWFLEREAENLGVRIAGISRAALEALVAHDWPGNIRQLEREMARAALFLEDGQLLQTGHLEERIRKGRREVPKTLREKLDRVERREIEAALRRHEGNLSAVARDLDVARSTLYRRMEELGIENG